MWHIWNVYGRIPSLYYIYYITNLLTATWHYCSYLSSKESEQSAAMYPLYDTIPYSDPAEVRSKGGPASKDSQGGEKTQTHKRAHTYEKIYDDVQQPSSSMHKDITVKLSPKIVIENVSIDEIQLQILENDDSV